MYRLMIADDEDDERLGIQFLMKKCGFSFDIIEASDGRDALNKLKENPVDILFTDVKMPFINGLELSAKAREMLPDVQIIFFSGYDDFEFVKQALSLQAVDYILKPVNPAEFQKVIALVLERMDQKAAAQEHKEQFQKTYVLTRLLNKMPYDRIQKNYQEKELLYLKEYSRIILLEFEEEFFGNIAADAQELGDSINERLPFSFDLLDLNPSQGVLLLKEHKLHDKECREIAQSVHGLIEDVYHTQTYLSVSPPVSKPQEIGNVYLEAEKYLEDRFFYKGTYVYPIEPFERTEETTEEITEETTEETSVEKEGQFLQVIERDVQCGDIYSLRRDMEILFQKCRDNKFQSYIYTRFICANLLKILYQELPVSNEQLVAKVEALYACSRFQEIETILAQAVTQLEEKLRSKQDSPKHVISIVEQYIHEHYMDVLSLDILADTAYLTPHYLSSIFSQEKGTGINKYIKNVRMDKAKELLLDTNMKISDICCAVGYSNLSYFCKAFRNEYGVTPEKYREHKSMENAISLKV